MAGIQGVLGRGQWLETQGILPELKKNEGGPFSWRKRKWVNSRVKALCQGGNETGDTSKE